MKTLIFALLFAIPAFSAEVSVEGRAYTLSCGYYSNQTADLILHYRNDFLPYGTKVFVHYGWGGTYVKYEGSGSSEVPLTWENQGSAEMKSIGLGRYEVHTSGIVAVRSKSQRFTKFEFALEVQQPNGQSFWEKGSDSALGHYYVTVLGSTAPQCVGGDNFPPFSPLAIQTVLKN